MSVTKVIIRPSPRLVGIFSITLLIAVAALPLPSLTGPAYAVGAVALVLALIDWLSTSNASVPEVQRILPERLIKDRHATVTYRILRGNSAGTALDVLDELPDAVGGDLLIENVKLRRGQIAEITRELVPKRRGAFVSGPMYLRWLSRMGLLRLRAAIPSDDTLAILPPAAVPQHRGGLTHRLLLEELGVRPRPLRGEGSEFESLREYVPGDDPRHIDWRASARHLRLQVRHFQTERRHTVVIALDTGRLMGAHVDGTSKLDHAINCSVALARASVGYGDRVGLLAFDSRLRLFVRPRSGPAAAGAVVQATTSLKPDLSEPNYRILAETLDRYQKKRALLVVLTDFVEGGGSGTLENYLVALARRHCVMLVALRDRMLRELDRREPEISREHLYRRLALQDLAAERETVLARIGRFGAQVLDLDPSQITAPVLNRYLAVRDAALI